MDTTRRPSTEDDKDFLFALARAAYTDVVTRQFGYWDEQYQRERFDESWRRGRFVIILFNGEQAGAVWTEWREDHAYIGEIQVLPEYQHRGIGTAYVREIQQAASLRGMPVRLQVLKFNRARRLYERLGFRYCGENETHCQMIFEVEAGNP